MKLQFLSRRYAFYAFVALALLTCMAVAVESDIDSTIDPALENLPGADSEITRLDCTAVMSPSIDNHGRPAGGMCTECMCNNGQRMPMFLCDKGHYPTECKNKSQELHAPKRHGHLDQRAI